MDLMEIAGSLINKIKKDYNGDVSLVHIHGSYVCNDTHEFSDLDLYIVPKTKRGFNLGTTFIFNGIGWDFWTLSWEQLEGIANHEWKFGSLITEGKLLYYHSQDDLERFNKLKEKAKDFSGYKDKGKEFLKNLYEDYFQIIGCNELTKIRESVIDIVYNLSSLLSEINNVFIKRGRKYLKDEILAMQKIPKDFELLYDMLFLENDVHKIKETLYTLIRNTEKLFTVEKTGTLMENFGGFYEEMIQSYNKIYHACDIGDIYTPLFASAELTSEINELLKKSDCPVTLPDMVGAYDPNNLEKIKTVAKQHQEKFVELLKENGIKIRAFNNMAELNVFLEKI